MIECALLVDEISKNSESKHFGIQISEDNNIGCLLWMDDMLLIIMAIVHE